MSPWSRAPDYRAWPGTCRPTNSISAITGLLEFSAAAESKCPARNESVRNGE